MGGACHTSLSLPTSNFHYPATEDTAEMKENSKTDTMNLSLLDL